MQYGTLRHKDYLPRIIDGRIPESLEDFGAICIQGPKYCGKTWTSQAFANSELNLMDPTGNFQNLELALAAPDMAIQGKTPRLIDEWQEAPLLWDAVRNAVDRSDKEQTFILTGSAVPRNEQPKHSGIGRIERLRMRPMSLAESDESEKSVSLKSLFDGSLPQGKAPDITLESICNMVIRGGWPASIDKAPARAQRIARNYITQICHDDLSRVDGVSRDPEKLERLLHSLARNAEQSTTTKTMIADMTNSDNKKELSPETVTDYLAALKKIFILEEIGSWSPNLRSPIRINKRPKYHFVDPSLPAAILKASSTSLLKDLETLGFLFECLCIRDLLVYAEAMDGGVFYYRDKDSLEVDAIIESPDGKWGAIEIKLGHNKADEASSHLLALKRKIHDAGGSLPAFLAVVEGLGKYAYQREDSVMIIPVTCLTA